jgi:hypothetical protein
MNRENGEHGGFRARMTGENHRTEVTEVTEGETGVDGRKFFGEHRGFRENDVMGEIIARRSQRGNWG